MSTTYKLTYFDGRGRGEIIRLILTAAGVPFEDNRIDFQTLESIRSTLPFGQLPVFQMGDKVMCQSLTIARYLARKYDLAGGSLEEQADVDMIVDCIEDTLKNNVLIFRESDPDKKAELKKKYAEEELPKHLTRIEKLLTTNNGGNGYFVGDKLTWADLYLVRAYGSLELISGLNQPFAKHQKLEALYQRVIGLPKIAEYQAKLPVTRF